MGPLSISLVFLVLSLSLESLAWGEHGHRTVGYLARLHFTKEAEALFNELVEPTASFDISDGAVWADSRSVQAKMPWSKPWHYIDAQDEPPKNCTINYNRDCDLQRHCVVSAIVNMVRNPHIGDHSPQISCLPPQLILSSISARPLNSTTRRKQKRNRPTLSNSFFIFSGTSPSHFILKRNAKAATT